jgi:16S rRNA processing protein RimM
MADPPVEYLVVGEILKPWGYRGEVKVKLFTDFPSRFIQHRTVYLGDAARAMHVQAARLHSGFALVKFAGLDTPEAAARLRGEVVRVPLTDAAPLEPGQYFQHQIIGLHVISTDGAPLGSVEEILETGANDVYLVRTPAGKELLIPAIASVVREIDLAAQKMTVTLLPGLGE